MSYKLASNLAINKLDLYMTCNYVNMELALVHVYTENHSI